jgi:hypothetical protein
LTVLPEERSSSRRKTTSWHGVLHSDRRLRVKTTALPINAPGGPQHAVAWRTECDDADELRLVGRGAQGEALATLVARSAGR